MKRVTKSFSFDAAGYNSHGLETYMELITHDSLGTEAAKLQLTHFAKGIHLENFNKIHKLCALSVVKYNREE